MFSPTNPIVNPIDRVFKTYFKKMIIINNKNKKGWDFCAEKLK